MEEVTGNNDIPKLPKYYFEHVYTLFRYLGINFYYDFGSKIITFLFPFFTAFMVGTWMVSWVVLETVYALKADDIDEMSFVLCYSATHVAGTYKTLMALVKKKKIEELLLKIQSGIFAPNLERGGSEEYKIIAKAIKIVNMMVDIFCSMVVVIITSRFIYIIIDNSKWKQIFDESLNTTVKMKVRELPYRNWSPCDTEYSPCFEIIFVYQYIATTLQGFYAGAVDMLIVGVLVMLRVQITILKNSLLSLVDRAKKKNGKLKEQFQNKEEEHKNLKNIIRLEIAECIKHHQEIIQIRDQMEKEFNTFILLQFFASLLIVCFSLFQISITDIKSASFVSIVTYVSAIIYQLFYYCYFGNELLVESVSLAQAAYDCEWVGTEFDVQKSLMLLMMRAQRPLYLTAGKFTILSLETFVSILRGSGSYFAVLREMNEEEA